MTRALMLADLKRSGITGNAANKLKLKVLSASQTKKLTGFDVPSYQIPYFDINGKKLDYYRVRYLAEVKGKFGATLTKAPRYSQPSDTLPHAYFPPVVDWAKLATDTSEPIVITEGEKKAIKGCLEGIPTIGLGGVWSWKSRKHNHSLIPCLRAIKWKGKKVYLCFDSDLNHNPHVIAALYSLARKLTELGAEVIIKYLPDNPDNKIGLDDYLLTHNVKHFMESLETEVFTTSEKLFWLNERIAFIENKNAVLEIDNGFMHPSKQSLAYRFGHVTYEVPAANGGLKTVVASNEWVGWPNRRTHRDILYAPGEPEVLDGNYINTWQGWGCEPKRGEVKPFLDLLDYVCGKEKEFKQWFLQWLAYPLQNPGAKMFSAVLLYSPHQGVGKSFIGLIMGDIYGDNFVSIDQEQLHSSFNGWAANKQLILGEEISGTDKRKDADRLKNMLTRETIYVNVKYQAEYTLRDCANYIFTSNHPDALFLEQSDRRVAVHEIPGLPREREFYKRVDTWRREGGAAALFDYLLNVDCSEFDPLAPAPLTAAKREMIELSRSDLDIRAHELREAPQLLLSTNGVPTDKELFTANELMHIVDPDQARHTTLIALSKALRRAGFRKRQIMTEQGTRKLWAIVNPDKWEKRTAKAWAVHYDKFTIDRSKYKAG